jgi:plasmid stabilization system protein ParE
VPELVYRAAALRDLADITTYIERESGSRAIADDFIGRLTNYCENLATLSGRDRSELRPGYRSTVFGN